jgi:hypothetical protein
MKLRHLVFVLVASYGISHSTIVLRGECVTWSLADDFKKSTAVFVGRAVAQSVAKTPEGLTTETTFEVERVWKGESGKTVRMHACGGRLGDESVTCSESFRFVEGSRYVVFAGGAPLSTTTCRHTALADAAKETLQWLSRKPSKKAA